MKKLFASFGYALRGVIFTVKNERNMRIHISFALLVVFFGFVCKISRTEWLALLLFISGVLSAEAHNTAAELTLDRISTEHSELTRHAKDSAAGAVLIRAVISAVGGGLIFFREARVKLALDFFERNLFAVPIFAIVALLLLIFIILPKKERKKK